jgi:hypothetical protein
VVAGIGENEGESMFGLMAQTQAFDFGELVVASRPGRVI